MQLADLDVLHVDASFCSRGAACPAGHTEAHQVNGAAVVERAVVRSELLARDEDGLILEMRACIEECLGNNDGGGSSIRRRATLQLSERFVDLGRLKNLLECVFVLELRVWVALRVLVVDTSNLGKVLCLSAVSSPC